MISVEYAAGFFDGEGSVMIRYDKRCNSYILKVSVTNCVRSILDAMKERWGGSVWDYAPRKVHHSGWSEWLLQGGGARAFLEAVRPFSVVKREQIDLGLALLDTYGRRPGCGRRLSPEVIATRCDLKNALHALKTKGHGLKGAS